MMKTIPINLSKGKSQHQPHKGVRGLGRHYTQGLAKRQTKGGSWGFSKGPDTLGPGKGAQQQSQKTRGHVDRSQRVSGALMGKDVPVSGVRDRAGLLRAKGREGAGKRHHPPTSGQRGQRLAHTPRTESLLCARPSLDPGGWPGAGPAPTAFSRALWLPHREREARPPTIPQQGKALGRARATACSENVFRTRV